MATVTVDWANLTVESTASILDLPAFKDTIRDLEDAAEGILYPAIITYKRVDLGGGSFFHAIDFINGYKLKFIGTGPFVINGNLNCDIVDTGVQVERKTSAAFSTTSAGGGGFQKNTERSNFAFVMLDGADHITPKTGLTVTGQRAIDGEGFSATANSPSEVGSGVYKINLAASDLDGDVITLRFTASGADPRIITIFTA